MGLFTQRPEENEDWAGLPSEPARDESTAERLTDASSYDAGGLDLFFGPGSVLIPVTPVELQSVDHSDADPEDPEDPEEPDAEH